MSDQLVKYNCTSHPKNKKTTNITSHPKKMNALYAMQMQCCWK